MDPRLFSTAPSSSSSSSGSSSSPLILNPLILSPSSSSSSSSSSSTSSSSSHLEEKDLATKLFWSLHQWSYRTDENETEETIQDEIKSIDLSLLDTLRLHPEILAEKDAIKLFQQAMEFGLRAVIDFFMTQKFKVPHEIQKEIYESGFLPPVYQAVGQGYPVAFIKRLIESGFEINFVVSWKTALDVATYEKQDNIKACLLKCGALTAEEVAGRNEETVITHTARRKAKR